MKQKFIAQIIVSVVCLFLLIFPCCFCSIGLADNDLSYPNSKTLFVGGSGPGNYSRIQDAVDNASSGDTVFVYDDSAPYYESITINVGISLIGEHRNTTSIEGGNHAISIYADGVNVSGFQITNVGDFWSACGFYVTSQGNTISDNNIINNLRMNGVFLDGASFNIISGNLIENNRYHGIRVEYGSFNQILDNVVVNNRGYGIYLHESPENTIIGNTVQQSFFEGMMCGNESGNNLIYHNNFIGNPSNAYDATGNIWDNGSSGNYWSDYLGTDGDGDGIGDTPYFIPGNVSEDRYPLMKPYEQYPTDLDITITGGVGVSIAVKNNGTQDILHIDWDARLDGGVVLFPSTRSFQGSVQFLGAGESVILQRIKVLFGFGIVDVNVTVGSITKSTRGVLFVVLFIPFSQ